MIKPIKDRNPDTKIVTIDYDAGIQSKSGKSYKTNAFKYWGEYGKGNFEKSYKKAEKHLHLT